MGVIWIKRQMCYTPSKAFENLVRRRPFQQTRIYVACVCVVGIIPPHTCCMHLVCVCCVCCALSDRQTQTATAHLLVAGVGSPFKTDLCAPVLRSLLVKSQTFNLFQYVRRDCSG